MAAKKINKTNLVFLMIILAILGGCKKKTTNNKKSKSLHINEKDLHKELADEYISGYEIKLLFYHGEYSNQPIMVKVSWAKGKAVFSFPSNSILAGMELRKDKNQAAVVDLSIRARAYISKAKQKYIFGDFNSRKPIDWKVLRRRLEDDFLSTVFTIKSYQKAKITRTQLKIISTQDKASSDKLKSLYQFIFYPFAFKIPANFPWKKMGFPSGFSWKWKHEQGGVINWKIVKITPKKFFPNQLNVDLDKFEESSIEKIFQGIIKHSMVSQNSLSLFSRKHLGIIYLNGKAVDLLAPANEVHLPLQRGAFVSIYPLFGGTPLLKRYLEKPFSWKFK